MLAIAVVLVVLVARAEASPRTRADDMALAKRYADILTGVDQDVADQAVDDDDDGDAEPADDDDDDELDDAPLPRRDPTTGASRIDNPSTGASSSDDRATDQARVDNLAPSSNAARIDERDPTTGAPSIDDSTPVASTGSSDVADDDPDAGAPHLDDTDDDALADLVDDDSPALGELTGLDLATLYPDPAELAAESAAFQIAGGAELFDAWQRHQRPSRFGRLDLDVRWRSYSSDPRIAPPHHSDELWLIATWRR